MADRRLEIFHTVGRLLSFTKAAEALQMTQPAVTFQIRQLEEEYNVRLFDRAHSKIHLTDAGKRMFEYAERIFNLYREMENTIHEVTDEVGGLLRIGASISVAECFLPNILARFQKSFPNVQLSLQALNTQEVFDLLEQRLIDIGIIEGTSEGYEFVNQYYTDEELVLVMPANHELASKRNVSPHVLAQQAWILREEGSHTRQVLLEYLQERGHPLSALTVAMELNSPEAIKGAIEAGLGISVLPRYAVSK
jgi:DNA-binding transcriptional LysR family regulator